MRVKGVRTMDLNNYSQLKRIFNTLKLIHTSGEDTILMSDCLQALKVLIENIQINDIQEV